jgi:hypothetical protein
VEQQTGVSVKGHIKIHDPNTGEVFVDKDNAINFEAMSIALAGSLASNLVTAAGGTATGPIFQMVFGNGGSSVDATGIITYLPPNVTGTTADLYNRTYPLAGDILAAGSIAAPTTTHVAGKLYSDLTISCTISYGQPAGQLPFDNDTNLTNDYTFDELGLTIGTAGQETLISHVIFHPVQKSLNREIRIDYTIRIQALTNLMSI